MKLNKKETDKLLVFLLIIGVAWRLYLAFNYAPVSGDSREYRQIAKNIIAGNGYSLKVKPPYKPTVYRAPGYPLYLASLYLFNDSNFFIRISQGILDILTCLLVYAIALSITGSYPISILALLLTVFCPYTAIYTTYILSETVATFFVTLSIYLYILAIKHKKTLHSFICGVAVGCAAMTRQNFLILFILSIFGLFVFLRRGEKTVFKITSAFLICSGFLLVASPWVFRNYLITKSFAPLLVYNQVKETGYDRWLSTWMDGEYLYPRYLWHQPGSADEFPDFAFSSEEERQETDRLLKIFFANRAGPYDFGLAQSSYSMLATPELKSYFEKRQIQEVLDGFGVLADRKIREGPFKYFITLRARRLFIMWGSTVFSLYPFKARIIDLIGKREFGLFLKNSLLFGLNLSYILFAVVGLVIAVSRYRLSPILVFPIISVSILGLATYPNLYETRFILEAYPCTLVLASIGMARSLRLEK